LGASLEEIRQKKLADTREQKSADTHLFAETSKSADTHLFAATVLTGTDRINTFYHQWFCEQSSRPLGSFHKLADTVMGTSFGRNIFPRINLTISQEFQERS
jgi:hypothetical protein